LILQGEQIKERVGRGKTLVEEERIILGKILTTERGKSIWAEQWRLPLFIMGGFFPSLGLTKGWRQVERKVLSNVQVGLSTPREGGNGKVISF